MSQERENEVSARRWIEELWNRRRDAIIDEMLSPTVSAHGMGPNGTTLIGPGGFRSAYELFTGAFPDVHLTIDQLVASGDLVAMHLTCRGTHQGNHLGIAASGRPVTFPAMTIARFHEGKIVEGWNVIDLLAVFQQVGAFKAAESLP